MTALVALILLVGGIGDEYDDSMGSVPGCVLSSGAHDSPCDTRDGVDLDALDYIAASWWVLSLMAGVATPEGSLPGGVPGSVVPRVQPDVVVGDAPNLQAIICNPRWEWSCSWALRTVYGGNPGCLNGESGGDVYAIGSQWYRGELWYFYGLWQIASRLPPGHPDIQFLFDPFLNTVEAHLKYTTQGRGAWPICGAP